MPPYMSSIHLSANGELTGTGARCGTASARCKHRVTAAGPTTGSRRASQRAPRTISRRWPGATGQLAVPGARSAPGTARFRFERPAAASNLGALVVHFFYSGFFDD